MISFWPTITFPISPDIFSFASLRRPIISRSPIRSAAMKPPYVCLDIFDPVSLIQ